MSSFDAIKEALKDPNCEVTTAPRGEEITHSM